ncbi:accessory gene regulator ArgB-like protein [Ruminiclostridium papyrosolvens]|uniref:Accessory gene regulator B n=1 Tax=Ruminiclostridium papyrosolvens C7 TaxID=1330534 RepID=U4R0F1_9FIRM|nr:accessory gene regulator B family protein [Ruminiclostridium papyrosolvens]EPR10136.1 accessory gene regulator B [Ruminiclostridium papyrosolvens C7]
MLSRITEYITKQAVLILPDITPEKAEKIEYGLYMGISDISKVLALLIVSIPLNIFLLVFTAILSAGSLRLSLGGIHSKTQIRCLISYFLSIYGSVYLSYIIPIKINIIIFIIVYTLTYLYAPADLPSKPIVSSKHKRKLRFYGFITLSLLLLLTTLVSTLFANIISINALIVSIMTTPLAYKLTGNTLSKKEG